MTTTRCRACKAIVLWARTVASESGAGGKPMPLDPEPNPEGNVAVRQTGPHTYLARALKKDETHDRTAEKLHMPHFATCPGSPGSVRNLVSEAEEFLKSVTTEGGETDG
ncbi:MAG: hypothetical protein ACRDQD_00705 [Nocardioidaceae bacterium]